MQRNFHYLLCHKAPNGNPSLPPEASSVQYPSSSTRPTGIRMHGSHSRGQGAAAIAAITAFMPRQVLLSAMKTTKNEAADGDGSSRLPPPSDSKNILLQAICQFLERNGFSKSAKKLRSEARFQVEGEQVGGLDLEQICNEYLKRSNLIADDNDEKKEGEGKKQEEKSKKKESFHGSQQIITSENTHILLDENKAKEKRKRKKEEGPSCDNSSFGVSLATVEKYANNEELTLDNNQDRKTLKKDNVPSEYVNSSKEKLPVEIFQEVAGEADKKVTSVSKGKKQKTKKDALDCSENENKEPALENVNLSVINVEDEGKNQRKDSTVEIISENGDANASKKKSKLKSKRKWEETPASDKSLPDTEALNKEEPPKKENTCTLADLTEEKKASKKRKFSSEERQNGFSEVKLDNYGSDEVRTSEELNKLPKSMAADGEVSKGVKGEVSQTNGVNGKVSQLNVLTASRKDADGTLANNGVNSSAQKSAKKQRNDSAELRTLNAFRRVKTEDVVFADEKLQDNSYWAKDGADSGYGAKAQEVLGQVKGRDFRHEKTKKKRGSYRGGQIDLQSHSVKFNYSDDE